MDNDYLHSIDASPYVEEGFLSHARATGAGLRQRLQNITPSEDPYHTPFYAQLMSHYNSFLKEVKAILSEFSVGPTSPSQRLQKMQLTAEERETVNSLVELYQYLVPSLFPAGTRPETKTNLARGLTPANISLAQAMKHSIKEAWGGRKVAQSGGEAGKIINKYVEDLKAAYAKFIGNISKLFPNTPKNLLSKEFKKNIGDPQVTNKVKKVEDVVGNAEPSATPAATSAVAEPNTATENPPAAAPNGGEKTTADDFVVLVAEALAIINQRVMQDEAHSSQYFAKKQPSGDYYLPTSIDEPAPTEPDWLNVPDNKKDLEKQAKMKTTGHYVQDPKTGQWKYNLPPPMTEAEGEEGSPESGDIRARDIGDEKYEETGLFVYDFASLYKKYPGEFQIEATQKGGKVIGLPSGKKKVIRVFWAWKKRQNSIIVKSRDEDNNTWTDGEILRFYDDQVNPRSPSYRFSAKEFAGQVNKNTEELFKGASQDQLKRVTEQEVIAKPSFYAVVRRKGPMEFKKKEVDAIGLYFPNGSTIDNSPNYGHVIVGRGKEKGVELTPNDLKVRYYTGDPVGNDKDIWQKALANLGYFEKIKNSDEEFKSVKDIIDGAKYDFIKNNPSADPKNVEEIIFGTCQELGTKILKMTPQQIASIAMGKASPADLAGKGDASEKPEKKNIGIIGWDEKGSVKIKDAKGNTIPIKANYIKDLDFETRSDLEKMGYWKKFPDVKGNPSPKGATPTAEPTPSDVSKPAGEPPKAADVTAPVSKPAGGEPEAAKVTAPVSTPAGKPDPSGGDTKLPSAKPVDKPKEKPRVPSGKVEFTEDGKVVWTKPDGKVVKLTPNQINNMASPRLMAALKKAKYPFDKFKVNIKETRNGFVNPFQFTNFL